MNKDDTGWVISIVALLAFLGFVAFKIENCQRNQDNIASERSRDESAHAAQARTQCLQSGGEVIDNNCIRRPACK